MNKNKNGSHRRIKTATTMAILLMLLGATFAAVWTNQQALNEATFYVNPGGRVHDDFNVESGNKDIYAENYGEEDITVRIKLSEYLELGEGAGKPADENLATSVIPGAELNERSTWTPYKLNQNSGQPVLTELRDHVTWTLGGDKVYMPTFNRDNNSFDTDATGDAKNIANGVVEGTTAVGDGTHNFWNIGDTHTDTLYTTDSIDADHTNEARETLKPDTAYDSLYVNNSPGIMTMKTWVDNDMPLGNFWVYDEDGWAYWANRLEPGDATSLLLNEIDISKIMNTNSYYAIHVDGIFFTERNLELFYSDMTEDAKDLLIEVFGLTKYSIEIKETGSAAGSDIEVTRGESVALEAIVTRMKPASPPTVLVNPVVEWEILSNVHPDTTIDSSGNLVTSPDETADVITVQAVSNGAYTMADVIVKDINYEIVLRPNNPSVMIGESIQLTPTVTMIKPGQAPQIITNPNVTWEIVSPHHANTTISNTGQLSVALSETATTVTVRATAYGQSVDVNVIVLVWQIGDIKQYGSIPWRVIAVDESGSYLLHTQWGYLNNQTYNANVNYTLFESSQIYGQMQNWFATNATDELKEMALDYQYQTNDGSPIAKGAIGAGIEFDFTTNAAMPANNNATYRNQIATRGITKPGTVRGDGHVFLLSLSEYNRYLGNQPAAWRAHRNGSATGALRYGILRSPINGAGNRKIVETSNAANPVLQAGFISTSGYHVVRPAVWVKP